MDSRSPRKKYPELFLTDANIDPRTRERTVPMKILNLSFGRTGTVSMQAALEILGYGPTLHGFNLFMQLQDVKMWQEGLELKFPGSSKSGAIREGKVFGRAEFDNLLGQYEVASDVPVIAFAEELIVAYEEAKVIIVERDIEDWYNSYNRTMISGIFNPISTAVVSFDPYLSLFQEMTKTWVRGWFRARTEKEFQGNARDVYREHYELVTRVTPRKRLLDFKLKDGWEPLCAFLDKPVPDVLFPRINETNTFKDKEGIMVQQAGIRVLMRIAPYAACIMAIIISFLWY